MTASKCCRNAFFLFPVSLDPFLLSVRVSFRSPVSSAGDMYLKQVLSCHFLAPQG